MGLNITLAVSREVAVEKIKQLLGSMSNDELEGVLYDLIGARRHYNFHISDVEHGPDNEVLVGIRR